MKLADAVPDAVDNVVDLVREMKGIPKKDDRRRELSYKAPHMVGFLPLTEPHP